MGLARCHVWLRGNCRHATLWAELVPGINQLPANQTGQPLTRDYRRSTKLAVPGFITDFSAAFGADHSQFSMDTSCDASKKHRQETLRDSPLEFPNMSKHLNGIRKMSILATSQIPEKNTSGRLRACHDCIATAAFHSCPAGFSGTTGRDSAFSKRQYHAILEFKFYLHTCPAHRFLFQRADNRRLTGCQADLRKTTVLSAEIGLPDLPCKASGLLVPQRNRLPAGSSQALPRVYGRQQGLSHSGYEPVHSCPHHS